MSSKMNQLAKDLKKVLTETDNKKPSPYDTQAEVIRVDGNTAWVHIPGGVEETPVRRTINAKEGDNVQVRISGGRAWITGNATNPPTDDTTANYAVSVNNETRNTIVELNTIVTEEIEATNARFGTVEADTAKIHDLTADQLTATVGYIGDLTAENITADNIIADHATIGSLNTNYAHITNGVIDNAEIDYADVNNLDAHYAEIDLANVNNAWIQNGIVKDAAISDAQIIGVSANKLTAGTIDASNITVTNLNADNITAGTLNGQRIGTGSLSLDKLSEDVYTETEIDNIVDDLNDRIDGAIETFTGTVVPTLNNQPASSWTTTELKDQHIGDVYYVVNNQSQQNGYCYRFTKSGSTYSWQLIKDSDVTAALSRLDTAEGKIGQIEVFDQTMATFKTETEGEISTLQTRTTNVETSLGDKVSTSTFNELSQTVDGNSANITTLSTITTNNGLTTTTNITNTVNNVSQTANGNSSKISSLTQTLGTNADGTTKAGDIVHQVSDIDQDLDSITTRVSKTEVRLNGQYATSSTGSSTTAKTATITPTLTGYTLEKGAIITVKFTNANTNSAPTLNVNSTGAKAIRTYSGGTLSEAEYKWPAGATMSFVYDGSYWRIQDSTELTRISSAESRITQNAESIELKVSKDGVISSINQSAESVTINANKVNIAGAAIFTSGRLSETSLDNAYDAKGAAAAVAETVPTDISDLSDTTGVIPTDISELSDTTHVIPDISGKADKSAAVARQQRIYYRKTTSGAPSKNTTWLATSGTGYGDWSLRIPQLTNGTTKYPYLYTAIQTQTVSQQASGTTCTCSDVLLDDTATIIDGGTIITGTVNANAVNAESGTFNVLNIPDLNASKITAGDIAADRIKANSIAAINSLTTGKINAERLAVNQITVGSLSDGANYSTTTQMNGAIGTAVDGIQVGGRNLLLKSDTEIAKDLSTSDTTTKVGDLSDYGKTILGVVGTKIAISFEAKASTAGLTIGGRYIRDTSNTPVTDTPTDIQTITLTTSWARYSGTCSITSTGAAVMYFYTGDNTATSGTVYVRNVKVEIGTKATDWTPAPEDTANENLLVDSQKMSAWAIGASSSIDSSGEYGVITLTGSSSNWSASINTYPTIRPSILDGTALWLSFDYKASASTSLVRALSGTASVEGSRGVTRTRYNSGTVTLPAASTWTRYVGEIPWTTLESLSLDSGDVNSVYLQLYNRTDNSTLQIRKVKFEHGSVATDWSVSPEDFKTYITRIDNAGIRIHPSNTENNSIKLNTDGMTVYKGGTADANSVAFYGDTARIGKESSGHVSIDSNSVDLYKGSVLMGSFSEYTSGTGQLTIYGANSVTTKVVPAGISISGSGDSSKAAFYSDRVRFGDNSSGHKYAMLWCSDNVGIDVTNSAGTGYLTTEGYIQSGKYVEANDGRLRSLYCYTNTIATDNRVAISTNGNLGRYASSSRRYKEQIEDSTFDPHGLYNLKARQFKYKDGYFAIDEDNTHAYDLQVGFIAEEVNEYYPPAVVRDENTGEIENWSERKLIPAMLTLIQELNDRIIELERQVNND